MHTLFNPENKFWNFMGKITDVACMSILWLITSLPIVTIGASTAAFYSFTLDAVQDAEGRVWSTYFSAFRENFRQATVLWLQREALWNTVKPMMPACFATVPLLKRLSQETVPRFAPHTETLSSRLHSLLPATNPWKPVCL